MTLTAFDPRTLEPGTTVRHRLTGSKAVLDRRKEDDSGWWLRGHGGLTDSVWDHGDWQVVPNHEVVRDAVNAALHPNGVAACETACTHVVAGRWTALGIANVIARREDLG